MKNGLIALLVLVSLIFGGIGIKAVFFPVHNVEKSIDMAYEVTDKTLDADKAIAEYEWFKRQEESIDALYKKEETAKQALEDFMSILPQDRSKWKRGDKDEWSRLNSNIVGISNMLDTAIAEYNARSKMVNRSIFKDNLPSNISRAYFAGKQLRNN